MYKIEKFLLDNKFKKVKEYDSGVIVYSDVEEEPQYVVEVALFTRKDPLVWETTIYNPYSLTFGSYRDDYNKPNIMDSMLALSKDFVNNAYGIKDWLKAVEDPWDQMEE